MENKVGCHMVGGEFFGWVRNWELGLGTEILQRRRGLGTRRRRRSYGLGRGTTH